MTGSYFHKLPNELIDQVLKHAININDNKSLWNLAHFIEVFPKYKQLLHSILHHMVEYIYAHDITIFKEFLKNNVNYNKKCYMTTGKILKFLDLYWDFLTNEKLYDNFDENIFLYACRYGQRSVVEHIVAKFPYTRNDIVKKVKLGNRSFLNYSNYYKIRNFYEVKAVKWASWNQNLPVIQYIVTHFQIKLVEIFHNIGVVYGGSLLNHYLDEYSYSLECVEIDQWLMDYYNLTYEQACKCKIISFGRQISDIASIAMQRYIIPL